MSEGVLRALIDASVARWREWILTAECSATIAVR